VVTTHALRVELAALLAGAASWGLALRAGRTAEFCFRGRRWANQLIVLRCALTKCYTQ